MKSFLLFLTLFFMAKAQTPSSEDEGLGGQFGQVALDILDVALQPLLHHDCYGFDWALDFGTDDIWGKDENGVSRVPNGLEWDLYTHVGQHWGCHQAQKNVLLAGEATTTHLVSYAGGFIPPTMFAVNFYASASANSIVSGDWEEVSLNGGLGLVAGEISAIIEVDDVTDPANVNVVKSVNFTLWSDTLFFKWFGTGERQEGDFIRTATLVASPNATLLHSAVIDFLQLIVGIPENLHIELELITSTDFGVLELDQKVPISSLGMEWTITISNWTCQSPSNKIGVELITMQEKATLLEGDGFKRLETDLPETNENSYWHFDNFARVTSSSKKRSVPKTLKVDIVEITGSDKLKEIDNLGMRAQMSGFASVKGLNVDTDLSVHRVRLFVDAPCPAIALIDPGFSLGRYPPIFDSNCNDGIQNGDETGADCGSANCGPCPTDCHQLPAKNCPRCSDGIQNGAEEGLDCGGPCPSCGSCTDLTMNGDEEGIDCGGSCPLSCEAAASIRDKENSGIDWWVWLIVGIVGCCLCIGAAVVIFLLFGAGVLGGGKDKKKRHRSQRGSLRYDTATTEMNRRATRSRGNSRAGRGLSHRSQSTVDLQSEVGATPSW